MVLKNGSPIEILPSPSCLHQRRNVPSNTTSIAATSKTLFANSKDSRDHSALFTRERTLCPRAANSSTANHQHHKGEDKHTARRIRRKRVPIPARRNAPESPSRHNEKALIASSNVHALKLARCSVTASECISAVPHQPRHKRGVFYRIPEPPAAPAEFVIGPCGTEHNAERQENPRCQRPRASKTRISAVRRPLSKKQWQKQTPPRNPRTPYKAEADGRSAPDPATVG